MSRNNGVLKALGLLESPEPKTMNPSSAMPKPAAVATRSSVQEHSTRRARLSQQLPKNYSEHSPKRPSKCKRGRHESADKAGLSSSVDKAGPAASPGEVTSGITLHGAQLSWAVLHGHKRVENRHFCMKAGWYALLPSASSSSLLSSSLTLSSRPPRLLRYVLHTGAATASHKSQEPLLTAVEEMPDEVQSPPPLTSVSPRLSHLLLLYPPLP